MVVDMNWEDITTDELLQRQQQLPEQLQQLQYPPEQDPRILQHVRNPEFLIDHVAPANNGSIMNDKFDGHDEIRNTNTSAITNRINNESRNEHEQQPQNETTNYHYLLQNLVPRRSVGRKIIMILLVLGFTLFFYDLIFVPANQQKCNLSNQLKGWENLDKALQTEVFGQHIAVDSVRRALYAHITDVKPKKALVLSFHGWLGSGKTHVSQLIAKHLYHDFEYSCSDDNNGNSPFVQAFIGPRHFLLDKSKLKENQDKLLKIVEETVKRCGRSLFLFDEVDKMPSEIFDVLIPFMDYHESIDGVDYRKAIFIFLSNTGGAKINNQLISLMKEKKREEVSLYDFRETIANGAFQEEGGLFRSEMISKSLVDQYVPFLQLERKHVILCAMKEIQRRNILYITPEKVADRVTYTRNNILGTNNRYLDFAVDGCKNIMTHTAYFLQDSAQAFKTHTEL